jgi:hypothetical protein
MSTFSRHSLYNTSAMCAEDSITLASFRLLGVESIQTPGLCRREHRPSSGPPRNQHSDHPMAQSIFTAPPVVADRICVLQWMQDSHVGSSALFSPGDQLPLEEIRSDHKLRPINFPYRDQDDLRCPICVCDFQRDDLVLHLACGHTFHLECVTKWFIDSGRLDCVHCTGAVRRDQVKARSYRKSRPLLSTLARRRWGPAKPELAELYCLQDLYSKEEAVAEHVRTFCLDLNLQRVLESTKDRSLAKISRVTRYAMVLLLVSEFQKFVQGYLDGRPSCDSSI